MLAVYPPHEATFKAHENIIVGNVCLYGATKVRVAFFSGITAAWCYREYTVDTLKTLKTQNH